MRFGFGARPAGVACLLSWLVSTGCSSGRADASSQATDGGEGATQATSGASEGASTTASDTAGAPAVASTGTAGLDATVVVEVAPAPVEPCESHTGERECDAAGCIWFATERVADLETCALEPAGFCAAASDSTGDDGYDSAFYERVGEVVHLRRVGRKASEFPGPEHPAGWTECGLGPGDPPECGCVCAAGHCPGDLALERLEACASPQPCADISAGDRGWSDGACHYQALAAQAAAVLRVAVAADERDIEDRVYLRGDGTATWLRSTCDRRDHSCRDRKWELPRLCNLRAPAEFVACAAASDPEARARCRDVAAWFGDCKLAPATCP